MVATSRALAGPPAAAHGWLDRAACAMHRRMVGATLTAMAAVAASGVPLAAGGPSMWPASHSEPRCSEDTRAPRRAHESVRVRVRARLRKVGWIFTQSTKARDFIISGAEAAQMAAVQAELGEAAVTAVVSLAPAEDGGSEAHFEAFQARAPPGRRAGRAAAHEMHRLYKVRRRMRSACRMHVRAWRPVTRGARARGIGRAGLSGARAPRRCPTRRCGSGRRAGSRRRRSPAACWRCATPRRAPPRRPRPAVPAPAHLWSSPVLAACPAQRRTLAQGRPPGTAPLLLRASSPSGGDAAPARWPSARGSPEREAGVHWQVALLTGGGRWAACRSRAPRRP